MTNPDLHNEFVGLIGRASPEPDRLASALVACVKAYQLMQDANDENRKAIARVAKKAREFDEALVALDPFSRHATEQALRVDWETGTILNQDTSLPQAGDLVPIYRDIDRYLDATKRPRGAPQKGAQKILIQGMAQACKTHGLRLGKPRHKTIFYDLVQQALQAVGHGTPADISTLVRDALR